MDSAILIGRDDERRLLHGLMRQKKNVLIVGAEGVGKSLLVEDAIAAGAVKIFSIPEAARRSRKPWSTWSGRQVAVKICKRKIF